VETSLASLAPDRLSSELKRSLSGATLLWAIASLSVLALSGLGLKISYEHALPVVVLLAWLGAECSARIPARLPIAVCGKCHRVTFLHTAWFRRLWPWRYCVSCGSDLHYACDKNHMLSLFEEEKLEAPYFCAKCGTQVPPQSLSAANFQDRLRELLERTPKGEAPSFYSSNLGLILKSVPEEKKLSKEYWPVVNTLALEGCPTDAGQAESLLIALIKKTAGSRYWESSYWNVQQTLIKARPTDPSPAKVLECVDQMLTDSGLEKDALTRMLQEVKDALEMQQEKDLKDLFG
jgi:hypothetical protein